MKIPLILISLILFIIPLKADENKPETNSFKGLFEIIEYDNNHLSKLFGKETQKAGLIKAKYIGPVTTLSWIKKEFIMIECMPTQSDTKWKKKKMILSISQMPNGTIVTGCFSPLDLMEKINEKEQQ